MKKKKKKKKKKKNKKKKKKKDEEEKKKKAKMKERRRRRKRRRRRRRRWSPDLFPCDFILWGYMKATVCHQCQQTPPNRNTGPLKQWLTGKGLTINGIINAYHMTYRTLTG
jgi:hypothetical protein